MTAEVMFNHLKSDTNWTAARQRANDTRELTAMPFYRSPVEEEERTRSVDNFPGLG